MPIRKSNAARETLTLVQTRKMKPLPVVLVGEAYRRAGEPVFPPYEEQKNA
jgi:hypothetical protein